MADARRKELSKNTKSDHLTVVNAFTVRMFQCFSFRNFYLGFMLYSKEKIPSAYALEYFLISTETKPN